MVKFLTMNDFDFKDKVAIVRVDFNSPVDIETKKVLDETRIRAHGETTIKELMEKGAKIVVLAHQGRKGKPDFTPLKQHAEILSKVLGKPVKYVDDLFGERAQRAVKKLKNGEVLVLENVRTYPLETEKGTPEEHSKKELVQKLAPLADVFVNDAFATAHRAHVSIVGFTAVLPSVAGRIMEKELKSLSKVLENPEKPCVYILGGAKADDSLKISKYVLDNGIADYVLTGGVAGQLFLAAKGFDLGKPNVYFLKQNQLLELIPGIRELMAEYLGAIKVPVDVAVEADRKRREVPVRELPTNYPIFDIGHETVKNYDKIIQRAKSIVLSGPMGVFENNEFSYGTKKVFGEVADSKAFSLAGGGHTVAALKEFRLAEKVSYISTAGGALTEFLMGEKLPGVVALEEAASRET